MPHRMSVAINNKTRGATYHQLVDLGRVISSLTSRKITSLTSSPRRSARARSRLLSVAVASSTAIAFAPHKSARSRRRAARSALLAFRRQVQSAAKPRRP